MQKMKKMGRENILFWKVSEVRSYPPTSHCEGWRKVLLPLMIPKQNGTMTGPYLKFDFDTSYVISLPLTLVTSLSDFVSIIPYPKSNQKTFFLIHEVTKHVETPKHQQRKIDFHCFIFYVW